MPIDPSLMGVVAGGAGKTGAGGMPGGAGASPQGSPMSTPQANEGEQQAAMIDISMALDLLERAMPPFGSESKQGQAIMKALSALSGEFGEKREKAKSLQPAELQHLVSSMGMKSPEMQAMGGGGQPQPGAAMGGGQPGMM